MAINERSPFGDAMFGNVSLAKKAYSSEPTKPEAIEKHLKALLENLTPGDGFLDHVSRILNRPYVLPPIKQVLEFGFDYHATGSVREAVSLMNGAVDSEAVTITHPGGVTTEGNLFGIVGKRAIGGRRPVLDCVMATDDGFTVAAMVLNRDHGLKFYARKGFAPGMRPQRAVEDVVVPQCIKTKKLPHL